MFLDIVLVILCTMLVAVVLNAMFSTRVPRGACDLLLLIFAPYVIYCLLVDKEKLK